jgi:hypothetical protein
MKESINICDRIALSSGNLDIEVRMESEDIYFDNEEGF